MDTKAPFPELRLFSSLNNKQFIIYILLWSPFIHFRGCLHFWVHINDSIMLIFGLNFILKTIFFFCVVFIRVIFFWGCLLFMIVFIFGVIFNCLFCVLYSVEFYVLPCVVFYVLYFVVSCIFLCFLFCALLCFVFCCFVCFWPRYYQNTARKPFEKLTFFVYYWLKNSNTQDPSGTLKGAHGYSRVSMSTHKPSWALMSTVKYGAKALWVVWASCRYTNECSFALMSAVCTMGPC